MSLILHIGPPKTATSYIQGCLIAARENPPENLVVANAGWYWNGHHQIPRQLSQHRVDPGTVPDSEVVSGDHLGNLRREIETFDDRDLVVSSETFSSLNRDEVGILREAIPEEVEVRIVVSVRALLVYYLSGWREWLKRGLVVPFPHDRVVGPAYFLGNWTDIVLPMAEMKEWMEKWVDAFGSDAINIFSVASSGSDPTVIWERFLEAGGANRTEDVLELSSAVQPLNESLDAWSTEVAMLAGVEVGLNDPEWDSTRWNGLTRTECAARFAQSLNALQDRMPNEVLAHDPNLVIEDEQMNVLRDALEADVELLSEYCTMFRFIGSRDDLYDHVSIRSAERLRTYRAFSTAFPPKLYASRLVTGLRTDVFSTVES